MPTTTLMPLPKQQYLSDRGTPLLAGKVYTYAAGTTDLKATYTDAAGTTPHANPITLNLRGEPPAPIFWSGSYRVDVRDALGNLVYTIDNYNTDPFGLLSLFAAQGAGKIGYQSPGNGVVRNIAAKLSEVVSFKDLGGVGDGVEVAANNAAWQKAAAYINNFPGATFEPIGLFIPDGHYKYSVTPTFTRPVRIFGNGGATLDYTGATEVLVMGNKAQTSAAAGTNDYYEIDNINFVGALNASAGIYFANWVLQPRVSNCRFLNFGGADMYAITFQGNNWSIDLLDNRYLTTDDVNFARHWCRCFGVSKTINGGAISAGQVVNGEYDGGNSRLNALNNWVRFGGGKPGVGYVVTGTKSRIVGGGVENPSVGVHCDGTGISLFGVEISQYFETPLGFACIQAAGNVSSLNVHDCFANIQNDSSYHSDARFFIYNGDAANVTSASFRDLTVLSASKHPLVTLRDALYQYDNKFSGNILTDAPLLCAVSSFYWMSFEGYHPGYHNADLLGGLDTTLAQLTPAAQRVSSRCFVNAGAVLTASVSAAAPGDKVPPCRSKHFSLNWSTVLAVGNYVALETRADDLGQFANNLATGSLVARYVNSAGAASINAVMQLTTYVGGISTVIASKNIVLTTDMQGFNLAQVVNTLKTGDSDRLTLNLVVQGAGHGGSSAVEIINMDVCGGSFPAPILPVDRTRQIAVANQWYRKINSAANQAAAMTALPIQIGTGWATAVRNINRISLAGVADAAIVPFGDSSVYVLPNPPTGSFDIVFSVAAE